MISIIPDYAYGSRLVWSNSTYCPDGRETYNFVRPSMGVRVGGSLLQHTLYSNIKGSKSLRVEGACPSPQGALRKKKQRST